jgi:type II restriction enzyme
MTRFNITKKNKSIRLNQKKLYSHFYNKIIEMDTRIKVTARRIHKELVEDFDIKGKIGSINLTLGGISVKYDGKDAVGHLLQEWIGEWMKSKNYYFRTKMNTQEFPDFLLSESDAENFLEIKTFHANASPAFDIANFDSYCNSLLNVPERIEADYLILSYTMENSKFKISDIWLKKVWEISSPSGPNPIKLQIKRGQIYNLRPCTWYSNRLSYQPFSSKIDFLKALSTTLPNYDQCKAYRDDWFENVVSRYKANTGIKL